MNCGQGKAQTSLEFLYTLGFMLLFFTAVLGIFYLAQTDLAEIGWRSESRALCRSAASQISSLASSGDGAVASLSLPPAIYSYSMMVFGPSRVITVAGEGKTASCMISTSNVTNGTSGSFSLNDGVRMENKNGGLVFG